jgi:hypothetical protein
MSTNLLGELAANNGTYFLVAPGEPKTYTANIDQIIHRGNGNKITALEVIRNGEYVDVLEDYISNLIVSLPVDLRITPQNNEVFARITVIGGGGFGGFELVLAP